MGVTYALDTNAVIAIINGRPEHARERLRSALEAGDAVVVSSVVLFELWYGIARSARTQQNASALRAFLSGAVRVLAFGEDDAKQAADIRASVEGHGEPIGPYDILIGAQALRLGQTLVTANDREFRRVAGLPLANWSS